MALLLEMTRLDGTAEVLGRVRPVSIEAPGVLRIDMGSMDDAMKALCELSIGRLVAVKTQDVWPKPAEGGAPQEDTKPQEPQPSRETAQAAPAAQAPAASVAAAPAKAREPAQEPAAAKVEAPAASGVPDTVVRAATLRPVVGWLHEAGTRGVPAMVEAVKALAPHVKLVADIVRNEPDKLAVRVERCMVTLNLIEAV